MNTALVTGATRGIGREIAIALKREGWLTHAVGRDRGRLNEMRADFGVLPLAVDITDRDQLQGIVEEMSINALIHAPLRWPLPNTFLGLSESDIDMALEVNLSTTLQLTRLVLPSMLNNERGDIVLVTPVINQSSGLIENVISQALLAFSEALRKELSSSNIKIHLLRVKAPPYEQVASDLAKSIS